MRKHPPTSPEKLKYKRGWAVFLALNHHLNEGDAGLQHHSSSSCWGRTWGNWTSLLCAGRGGAGLWLKETVDDLTTNSFFQMKHLNSDGNTEQIQNAEKNAVSSWSKELRWGVDEEGPLISNSWKASQRKSKIHYRGSQKQLWRQGLWQRHEIPPALRYCSHRTLFSHRSIKKMQWKRKEGREKPTFPGEHSLEHQLLAVLPDTSPLWTCSPSIHFQSVAINPSFFLLFHVIFIAIAWGGRIATVLCAQGQPVDRGHLGPQCQRGWVSPFHTDHGSCAGKKSGKEQEAVTRLSHDDAFAFLLLQPRQTFMFSLLSCLASL